MATQLKEKAHEVPVQNVALADVSSLPQALDIRRIMWNAVRAGIPCILFYEVVKLFSQRRATQLVEFVFFIGVLTVAMVCYKRLNGIKVVW